MTVATTTSRVEHAGDGSSTAFAVPYYFLANGDLKVYSGGTLQTLTTHYSVSGAGNPAGGTVTFVTAPASGDAVVIFRDPALTQGVDYEPNDPFPAESHEQALDRLTMIAQRNRDLMERSLKLPDGEANAADLTLPDLATRASKTFYWNSNGEPTVADVSAVSVTFSPDVQTFSGDGSTVAFTLAEAPGSAAALVVAISGVMQTPGVDYNVSNTTLTFTSAPPSGTGNVVVQNFGIARAVNTNDADAVTYTPGGSGAVNTDVQTKLRELVSPLDTGAIGDGTTDDTAAIVRLVAALAASGGGVVNLCGKTYYMAAGVVDFSALSNVTFFGPGGFKGPAVSPSVGPTLGIKCFGTVGAAVAYGSSISAGAASFTVANSFAAGDTLMVSNFPTDATDAYTLVGSPDMFGNDARLYATTNTSNLRQTRRKELLTVAAASGSAFTTTTGVYNAYSSTTSLQFQKVTPAENIRFIGVKFENVYWMGWYTKGIEFLGCYGVSSLIAMLTSESFKIDFAEWDSGYSLGRIAIYEACRGYQITGVYKNFSVPSDQGIIVPTQSTDFSVDVVVQGAVGSAGHAVHMDTEFTENPTGYTSLPCLNWNVRVVSKGSNGDAVVASCDPWAALCGDGTITVSSQDGGVQLNGTQNVAVFGAIDYQDGSSNSIHLYGAQNTQIYGHIKGGIYRQTITNVRNGANTQAVSNISLHGKFMTASSQPSFLAVLTSVQSNATGDGTELAIPFNSNNYDKNSNHSGGTFTAPIEGVYQFNITIKLNSVGAAHTSGWVRLLAGGTSYYLQPSPAAIADASGNCALTFSTQAYMTAGQTAQAYLKVSGSTKTVSIQGSGLLETFWSGALVN